MCVCKVGGGRYWYAEKLCSVLTLVVKIGDQHRNHQELSNYHHRDNSVNKWVFYIQQLFQSPCCFSHRMFWPFTFILWLARQTDPAIGTITIKGYTVIRVTRSQLYQNKIVCPSLQRTEPNHSGCRHCAEYILCYGYKNLIARNGSPSWHWAASVTSVLQFWNVHGMLSVSQWTVMLFVSKGLCCY